MASPTSSSAPDPTLNAFDPLLNEKPQKYALGITCTLESLFEVGKTPSYEQELAAIPKTFNFAAAWEMSGLVGKMDVTPKFMQVVQKGVQERGNKTPPSTQNTPPSTANTPPITNTQKI